MIKKAFLRTVIGLSAGLLAVRATNAGRDEHAASDYVTLHFGVRVEGPEGADFTDVQRRLTTALERMGLMLRESSPYQLLGAATVADDAVVEGGVDGSRHLVIVELQVELKDTRDGEVLGSAVFTSKGMGPSRARALRKAAKGFRFTRPDDRKALEALHARALDRVLAVLNERCDGLLQEARQLYDRRQFRRALTPLSAIVPAASGYAEAELLKKRIREELRRQEENRIRALEAEAREAEARKMQAMHEAEAAQAHAQAMADSLEAAKARLEAIREQAAEAEDERKHELEMQEKKIRALEVENDTARLRQETARTELAKVTVQHRERLQSLDTADERFRPEDVKRPPPSEEGFSITEPIEPARLAGTWELVCEDSSLANTELTALTLQLTPEGHLTAWALKRDNSMAVGRGSFTIDRNRLRFRFERSRPEPLAETYEARFRGDTRLYLLGPEEHELALLRVLP